MWAARWVYLPLSRLGALWANWAASVGRCPILFLVVNRPARRRPCAECVSALQAQGGNGQRALGLLLDAAHVLNRPAEFRAPYEVAQSCLRGALDSVLSIAGEDFPGLRSATRAVSEAAGAVADAWRQQGRVGAGELDVLVGAIEELRAEQAERGGFRTRQIGHLVAAQTRQEMGLAETEAARSWSAFYSSASGVLHGSSSGADEARRQFEDVMAAMEQLFLGLPERADRLRELGRLEVPVQQDADEVARMTDPRAGMYFFSAAVSGRWLGLLPLYRLLPRRAAGRPRPICGGCWRRSRSGCVPGWRGIWTRSVRTGLVRCCRWSPW